jgi:hypothetical protein
MGVGMAYETDGVLTALLESSGVDGWKKSSEVSMQRFGGWDVNSVGAYDFWSEGDADGVIDRGVPRPPRTSWEGNGIGVGARS